MSKYDDAREARNTAAMAYTKVLMKRLRKEFKGHKVRLVERGFTGRGAVQLDLFPSSVRGGYGSVTFELLDANRYRTDLSRSPERLKVDGGHGGIHATYKLKDGVLPEKTMEKMLSRVRATVDAGIERKRREEEAEQAQKRNANLAREVLRQAGYRVDKELTTRWREGFKFEARHRVLDVTVEVVTHGLNAVDVSLYLSRDEYICHPNRVADYADALVQHAERMEKLREEDGE